MKKHLLFPLLFLLPCLASATALPPVQTVFVIVMENEAWADVRGSTNAPYINNVLLPTASSCGAYYNVPNLHPSLPNYIWLEAGTNFNVVDDGNPDTDHQNTTNHLVAQLRAAGVSWKAYLENIPGNVVPLTDYAGYAVRHNPFVYFDDVTGTNDPSYTYGIAHNRPYTEFGPDLTNSAVARYNFIIPNICNDGHDSCPPFNDPVQQVDNWLSLEVPKILNSEPYKNNGALFITWEESIRPDQRIDMLVVSPLARGVGYSNSIYYTHSSLLRTLQEIFGVGPFLGDAANSTDLSDLFLQFGISRVAKMPSGAIQLSLVGITPGRTNIIEASTNLLSWIPVLTNVATTNTFALVDTDAINFNRRFYRLLQLP